jgi:pyruvate dehydrogenase E2 component (dihydrolipoamide acetyltransferase)
MSEFRLPDLGEGLTEAELVDWRVAVGDEVQVDQVIADVETAKAVVELPVPFAGTVTALHARPGERIAVGRPLISVAAADGRFAEPGIETPAVEPEAAPAASSAEAASGNVLIGYGTSGTATRRRHRRLRSTSRTEAAGFADGPVPVVSPLVRKQARDAGLDLRALRGTGPGGLVRRRDVEAALAAGSTTPAATGEERIPLTGARRIAAERLTRSRREIPEATVWVDVDATELLAARTVLQRAEPERPVSVLALVARFALLGLRRYPALNGRIEGDELVLPAAVHLGFAAQTERGLVVPVVRDAQALTTRELSAAIGTLTARARDGALGPGELTGGTFTVNNYGVFGVDGSAAIINHPEVAILGLGRIVDKPWVVDGTLAVRKVTQLTLAFDHRACDGGVAGGFLRFVADCVEAPLVALGEL